MQRQERFLTNSLFAANNVLTTTSISFQLTQSAISNSTTQPSSLADTHQSPFLSSSVMAVFPTISSSPNEAPIIVSVVGVCAVVLLLIVCSSLIVILIVIHQRRKKKGQSYTTSKDNG